MVAALVALWTPALLEASPSLLFWFIAACVAVAALIGLLWINRCPRVADHESAATAPATSLVPGRAGTAPHESGEEA